MTIELHLTWNAYYSVWVHDLYLKDLIWINWNEYLWQLCWNSFYYKMVKFQWVISLRFSRNSILSSINESTNILSSVYTIHTVEWIFTAIMLVYFFNLGISIHDVLTLSFIQHFMLDYLYETMVYIYTWFTIKAPQWILLTMFQHIDLFQSINLLVFIVDLNTTWNVIYAV